jgi:hypothetical protein
MRGPTLTALALLAAVVVSSCGGASHASTTTTTRSAASPSTSHQPSAEQKRTCDRRGTDELQEAGLTVQQPVVPQWSPTDRVYSCSLSVGYGTLVLSVKDLADKAAAASYFASVEQRSDINERNLGLEDSDESFSARDGTVVARKGPRVLTVNVGQMAQRIGVVTKAQVAVTVANEVLEAWALD